MSLAAYRPSPWNEHKHTHTVSRETQLGCWDLLFVCVCMFVCVSHLDARPGQVDVALPLHLHPPVLVRLGLLAMGRSAHPNLPWQHQQARGHAHRADHTHRPCLQGLGRSTTGEGVRSAGRRGAEKQDRI